MRIGENPEKANKEIEITNYHRVVIPVYIPHFEGYFAQQFEVFKLCIGSLLKTCHTKTRITIYNNNSHPDVKAFLDQQYQENELIDQVFHSKENVGKINAILAAVKGNIEPLITISDADVLFKQDWQMAVEDLLIGFPEAGMICPVPNSKGIYNFVNNNWYYGFFKGSLNFEDVKDPESMLRFDRSLGNAKSLLKPIHLKKYLVLQNSRKTHKAVMGGGHFVATLRREVFDKGTNEPAFIKITGGVESKFIDFPNQNLGYLRISTLDNFAYHLGNTTEKWMYEEFDSIIPKENFSNYKASSFKIKAISKFGQYIGFMIQQVIRKSNFIKFKILNYLGLNASDY